MTTQTIFMPKYIRQDLEKLNLKNEVEKVYEEMSNYVDFSECTTREFNKEARIADKVVTANKDLGDIDFSSMTAEEIMAMGAKLMEA